MKPLAVFCADITVTFPSHMARFMRHRGGFVSSNDLYGSPMSYTRTALLHWSGEHTCIESALQA